MPIAPTRSIWRGSVRRGVRSYSSNWYNRVGAAWSPFGVLPNSNSLVLLGATGTYTGAYRVGDSRDTTIDTLRISNANATLALSALRGNVVFDIANASGTNSVSVGTITVAANTTLEIHGTFNNNGTISIARSGVIELDGRLAGTGSLVLHSNSAVAGSTPATLIITGDSTIVAGQTVEMIAASHQDTGDMIVGTGGVVKLTNAGTIVGHGTIGNGDIELLNIGVIEANDSGTISINASGTMINRGTLETNSGTLIIAGALQNLGTVSLGAGVGNSITGAVTGKGTILLSGTALELGSSIVADQTITLDGGRLELAHAEDFHATVADLSTGETIKLDDFLAQDDPTIASVSGTGNAGTNTVVTITQGTLTAQINLLNQYANEFAVDPSAYQLVHAKSNNVVVTSFELAAAH